MCGIIGIYLRDGLVRREQIDAMTAAIVHRGPDEDGVFVDGPIGLGMRRLSIIDLAGGQQPIANEDGRVRVVQNGEIYNFRELRHDLEARGHHFHTRSDTEAIVHAYEEWGGFDFASHLRGMFAIAVWDGIRKELWLTRDRIGIKPIYYAETPAGLAFGSEVKSLLATSIVRPELEPRVLWQYFTYGNAGLEDSFVRGVRQLRPGCVLRFNGEHSKTRPYWELRIPKHRAAVDEREAVRSLQERLRETVRTHLVSDVPVGAFLSGGVDSSAIVGTMVQEGCTQIKTFSIGFGNAELNELPYAQKVAERWHTDHYTEMVRPEDAISVLDQLLCHLDEPFADASAIPTWYVSRLAGARSKSCLRAMVGMSCLLDTRVTRRLCETRIWITSPSCSVNGARRQLHPAALFSREVLPGLFSPRQAEPVHLQSKYHTQAPLRRLLRPEWWPERQGMVEPALEWSRMMQRSGAESLLEECMYLDTMHYLPCDILVKVDRMTMAHSLEARPPLLDHEFPEFVASLPIGLKYSRTGRQKHVFKQAIAAIVPEGTCERKKAGFEVPLQAWFAGPLASLFIDCVLTDGRCGQYLDPCVVRALFEESRRGRRDHGLKLWAILVFEMWLRRVTN